MLLSCHCSVIFAVRDESLFFGKEKTLKFLLTALYLTERLRFYPLLLFEFGRQWVRVRVRVS